ncbi:MAG: DUF3160 domain-containing protein [Chloroflexota bacterium]|nr:DUF3160 domain-containing protein [Chloroflexota bacterium]
MESKLGRGSLLLLAMVILVTSAWATNRHSSTRLLHDHKEISSDPRLIISSQYEVEGFPDIPEGTLSYSLPLDLSTVVNIENVESFFSLTDEQKALLSSNGFVSIPWYGSNIVKPYQQLRKERIPIFITSDLLSHLYHIWFEGILVRLESEQLYQQLSSLSKAMMTRAIEDFHALDNPLLKEAARRNVAYFGVAVKILESPIPGYMGNKHYPREMPMAYPDFVSEEIDQEFNNIKAHKGFEPSAILNTPESTNVYKEDYSKYMPKGHYAQSEILSNYYRAMTWYGSIPFFIEGGDTEGTVIGQNDATIATLQAAIIAAEMSDVDVEGESAWNVWDRIYGTTSFFWGFGDQLNPYDYVYVLTDVLEDKVDLTKLADEQNFLDLKAALYQRCNNSIYEETINKTIPQLANKNKSTQDMTSNAGMRFMGSSFTMDSYIFQNLLSPAVGEHTGNGNPFTLYKGKRTIPKGLDLMAALGSARAYELLLKKGDTEYKNQNSSYDRQLTTIRDDLESLDLEEWNSNLYWSWLYTLSPLVSEYDDSYPIFMQTKAWLDKSLYTALASWTQLHSITSTRLVSAQPFGHGITVTTTLLDDKDIVPGYIEPIPEFYARLLALTRMIRHGLAEIGVLTGTECANLWSMESGLQNLQRMALRELRNEELTTDDYRFIMTFAEGLDAIVGAESSRDIQSTRGKETLVITSVYKDIHSGQVLEEAVGYIDMTLVAYQLLNGDIMIGAGPTLSYYEFKRSFDHPMDYTIWIELLLTGSKPPRPYWTNSFYQDY